MPITDQVELIDRADISVGDTETLTPVEWGAVVKLLVVLWSKAGFKSRRRFSKGQVLAGQFKISPDARDVVIPVLSCVGAACDHAQNRQGPIPYLLCFLVPLTAARIKTEDFPTLRKLASL